MKRLSREVRAYKRYLNRYLKSTLDNPKWILRQIEEHPTYNNVIGIKLKLP